MRVTADNLMMGGWHRGGYFDMQNMKHKTIWALHANPLPETGLTFHEAVKAYKDGMRDEV